MVVDAQIWSAVAAIAPPAVMHEALRIVTSGGVDVVDAQQTGPRLVVSVDVLASDAVNEVSLSLDSRAAGEVDTWCSCGRAPACPHTAAALLVVFEELAAPQRAPQPMPAWQVALDDLLLDEPGSGAAELCLFLSVRQSSTTAWNGDRRRVLRLTARPGVRGARGAWIKGQASWGRLDRLDAAEEAVTQLETLHRLSSASSLYGWYGREQEWLPLDDVPSSALWPQLRLIEQAGVPFVSAARAQHPVVLSDTPVQARVDLGARKAGLRMAASFAGVPAEIAQQPRWLVGDPAVAVAYVDDRDGPAERITLLPLSEPVPAAARKLLSRKGAVTVGSDDIEPFVRDYLPRLQAVVPVESADGTFAVPERPTSVLELRVAHSAQEALLSWRWDRSAVLGRADRAREAALLRAVRDVLGDAGATLLPAGSPADAAGIGPGTALRGAQAVLFVAEVLPRLREIEGLRVVDAGELTDYRAAGEAPVVALRTGADDGTDWFDLHVTVTVGGEEVDFSALFTALTLQDPIFVLPSGVYFPLDAPELGRLRAIVDEARMLSDRPVDRLRVSRYSLDLWEELVELGIVAAQEAEWWLRVRSLSDAAVLQPVPPPSGLDATLREYQHEGLAWLHFLRVNGLGGILADDMGLGKTVQAIAMMEQARSEDPAMAPFLIVAPTSVVGNWASECARFAPGLRVVTVTTAESRRGVALAEAVAGAHVVVTSYALFRIEQEDYRGLEWSGLILDEAQQIKNHTSQGYRAARMLGAPFTLAITGTPMENNLLELWALASLVAPGLLGSKTQFTEFYRTPIEKQGDAERLGVLRRRLRPFLLRRTKEVVAADLPPKQEKILEVDLHPAHRHLYERRFQRERQKLLGLVDDVQANRFQIFRSLTLLRQLALDPALVDEGEAPSAKLDALIDLLAEATAEGHRVLVLSQFTRFLAAARARADAAGIAHVYLDGSTTGRQRVIDGFRQGEASTFFISLKAGGFGLNLVEADYVVLLDPWWNPAVEEQAIDRAHRIGQTRPVIVYRLVARDTIEQKVIALKESKAQLFERVLDGGEQELGTGALSAEDIRSLVD
ncbi:DEAD/DEAH box helicase [Microbacterium sp. 18062]|uniref:DEAD/DEAH box helicase n=1 Tax=Microbacterium sp. 18062 TaxID=2681410 RepID=UPI00135C32CB|nr:DEAD/DEAH box helicase [Microbacterium sp. 18062]